MSHDELAQIVEQTPEAPGLAAAFSGLLMLPFNRLLNRPDRRSGRATVAP